MIQGKNGSDGDDADIPDYIHSTYIGSTEIRSPEITGNNISAYGSFKALDKNGHECGFFGSATGKDGDRTTYGVALACSATVDNAYRITYDTTGNYIVVTDAGVRMQSGSNSIVVRDDGVWINVNNGSLWCNNTQLG